MLTKVKDAIFFHVNRNIAYNPNALMAVGSSLECGNTINPYFDYFYKQLLFCNLRQQDGSIKPIAPLHALDASRKGNITLDNPHQYAYDTSYHYYKLTRELLWEQIRLELAPQAPSRHKCLWLTEDLHSARQWFSRLTQGDNVNCRSQILEVCASGFVFTADAKLLNCEHMNLTEMTDSARRYWSAERTPEPDKEVLFKGIILVKDIIDSSKS